MRRLDALARGTSHPRTLSIITPQVRIAISTGGGDAPGLNAVIRAAALSAITRRWELLGIKRVFAGLMGQDEVSTLRKDEDRSDELMENASRLGIDALISVGGDGSLDIARRLCNKGMKSVCVPKTIDNDVSGTVTTFGFDTAVNTALEAIDRLHTTAESHDRVMVMEVMGRDAGFIALHAGVAGTADVILIPEIPYDIGKVCEKIRARDAAGRLFSIVIVAEGAFPRGGGSHTLGESLPGQARRIGGVADAIAREIQTITGKETRSLVLGHLQRGGMPTGYDRLLATRFGGAAVRAIADEKWGQMVALQSPHIVTIPIEEVLGEVKRVDPTHDVVQTARSTGISFGD